MAVFLPTTKAGKKGKTYIVQFADAGGVVRRLPAFTSQAASRELERSLLKLVALRAAGAGPDSELVKQMEAWPAGLRDRLVKWGLIARERAAAGKGLEKHVADWQTSLRGKGATEAYVIQVAGKIKSVAAFCGWKALGDITPEGFDEWRTEQLAAGLSIQSTNHYLTVLRSFLNWLRKQRRISENPLAFLGKQNAQTDRRRVRRSLTEEEIGKLLAATESSEKHHGMSGPERSLLYKLALSTGLRYNELYTLRKTNFDLEALTPSVTVQAKNAKNKKTAMLPLRPDIAIELKKHMALFLPGANAFPNMQCGKGAGMLAVDLAAAGIPLLDEAGEALDFHALRHTFASLGAKAGIPLAVMQKLMRHSDPKLTAGVYTHLRLVDEAVELAKIPNFIPTAGPETEAAKATGTDGKPAENNSVMHDIKNDTKIDTTGKNPSQFIRTYNDDRSCQNVELRKTPSPQHIENKGEIMEAATRVELVNDGFANHCLTVWLRRPEPVA